MERTKWKIYPRIFEQDNEEETTKLDFIESEQNNNNVNNKMKEWNQRKEWHN